MSALSLGANQALPSIQVFYGTPHQPSVSQTWVLSTLRLLNFRFGGLMGPWVPTYIEAMSVYQQRLNDGFRSIASDLRVVNICQATDSPNHDIVSANTGLSSSNHDQPSG